MKQFLLLPLIQGIKLVNLAEDILAEGLSLNDFPMVTPADEDDMYFVLEGNRRVAAMKLMTSPSLLTSIGLPRNITARFKELHVLFHKVGALNRPACSG